MKIPTVDFTDETLAIDDTHGYDVRGGDWAAGAVGSLVGQIAKIKVGLWFVRLLMSCLISSLPLT